MTAVPRTYSFAASIAGVTLLSACAMTKGPPPPVEVQPGLIGVAVVGPPKESELPITAAEAAAMFGLFSAFYPPFFYFGSPIIAYQSGKCADAIYKAYPNLPSQFKEAVAREFSRESFRSSFVEAMKARTRSPVIPIEETSGAGHFTHATALAEAVKEGMDSLVELGGLVVDLLGPNPLDDKCDNANLTLRVEVQATRVKDQQILYKSSIYANCSVSVPFETVGKWLNEPGALAAEIGPCTEDLAHKVLDYGSERWHTDGPQLKLPE